MFGLHKYTLLGALLVGALSILAVGGVGYRMGQTETQQRWDHERAKTLSETADALALLAQRSAAFERSYQVEAAKKSKVVERKITEVRNVYIKEPERDCALRNESRELWVNTICAFDRNSSRSECLLSSVPGDTDATSQGVTRTTQ